MRFALDSSAKNAIRWGRVLDPQKNNAFVEEQSSTRGGLNSMAKAMTKSKIVAAVAEKAGISKKQTALVLETLAQMAYKEAKNGFTFPGVGKLVVRSYKARMGRNPQTGEAIKIPARKRLKFVVAKAAKDSVL
jgi:DNA-binding protein HU-beta